MFDRVEKFIGKENLEKIKGKTVAVVGLGGVGGYAVEGLVRSGVSSIIIVDYDVIDESNLNRQIITNQSNIGRDKVDVMKEHILSIYPNCKVIGLHMKLDLENIEKLFDYSFDYLVDANDTIVVKEELIRLCLEKNIKIISSMGTGNKMNISGLEIANIWDTSYDPIAKRIRKYLKENHIYKKVPVIYSKECNDKFEGSIPSMVFVPAVSGLMCANYVIKDIINWK